MTLTAQMDLKSHNRTMFAAAEQVRFRAKSERFARFPGKPFGLVHRIASQSHPRKF